ncbi:peptidylprolyl isomerase [Thermosipho melanesiensis]|uniref:Peptidyl-prolyl cis-trans isomerase n=2 Tax=Thermosipho melanesiensis TaxID=46541 RepID=A6LJ69_THEM4|nr:peptidylprolyl isomerase [Thermosipho melanesiensis]ABR29970.1 peptidylprolyl isomerase, FKBP-type [Thermosipho melanesiensis BI429]APT73174.1 peptidylprolyl isomerase [Thermosipho melanesiensis]OOC38571.1 peptidylprolyl isomerase [Thermosipho melanesiensis]OOC40375.1 peptidylprolyl isomerase [Thermosipho melanesiensis]OOC40639.1 peptidylprolyl isomerase [Thermosipho melanesiensis]
MGIKKGDKVLVHYVGKFENGEIFDSSEGKEPLEFVVGEGQIILGFEEQILGMEVGEKKTINVPYDKAYGEYREDLIFPVDKTQLPENVEVGQLFEVHQPDGGAFIVKVSEILEDKVMLDANHPLAGKNLIFDVEIVSIS